jgi:hypothetical protein
MRIILKPGGMAVLAGAFTLLVGVTIVATRLHPATASAPNAAASKPAVKGKPKSVTKNVDGLSAGKPGVNILSDGKPWRYSVSTDGVVSELESSAEEMPGAEGNAKGLRFHIKNLGPNPKPSGVMLKHTIPAALPVGEGYRLRFRACSPDASPIRVMVELAQKPYNKSLSQEIPLTKDWQEFSFPFRSIGYDTEGSNVTIFLSYKTGVVRIGDIQLVPDKDAASLPMPPPDLSATSNPLPTPSPSPSAPASNSTR